MAPALLSALDYGVSGRRLCAHVMCNAQVACANIDVHAFLCIMQIARHEYRAQTSLGEDMVSVNGKLLVLLHASSFVECVNASMSPAYACNVRKKDVATLYKYCHDL